MNTHSTTPADAIANRIAVRYAHPSRTAYLYLFWLESTRQPAMVIPPINSIHAAWCDEGGGLQPTDSATVLEKCSAAAANRALRPQTAHERRLHMARIVTIVIDAESDGQILVTLVSRALNFTPKGDRTVREYWRRDEHGVWYSAPVGRE